MSGTCQSEGAVQMPQPDPSELPTGAADAAMGHPNVNIGFLPCLGLI